MKFNEDCKGCRFRRTPSVCRNCDVGELYEDKDAPTVDIAFREEPSRFGESVTTDDIERRFDPNRFVDELDEKDDCDDDEDA